MLRKVGKVITGAGLSYGGFKILDEKFQIGNDFDLIRTLFGAVAPLETAPASMTVCDVWEATVERCGDKPAVVYTRDNRVLTFNELDQLANRIAVFARNTFQAGDVCALFMENRPEFLAILLGLSKAGVVVALINSNNKHKPLLHSLNVAHCKGIIFGTELTESVEEVLDEIVKDGILAYSCDDITVPDSLGRALPHVERLEDMLPKDKIVRADRSWRESRGKFTPFGYIYTSGTTGLPKACVITNYKYLIMSSSAKLFKVTEEDRLFTCLPLYHSAGLGLGWGNTVLQGCTLILARKFSAKRFMKDATLHHATVMQYIGELCRYLLNSPETEWDKKNTFRVAIGNGLRKELWVNFQKRFGIPEIGEFYGSTEGNIAFGNHCKGVLDGDLAAVGAVGRMGTIARTVSGFRIVKHDVENEIPYRDPATGCCIECEPGEAGELLGKIDPSRASSQFQGYTSKEATEKKIVTDVLQKGDQYFRTGDLMMRDNNGYIYFVDRIGDTFRWKGENVSTGEVAEAVNVFPGVLESNIYGVKVPGNEDGRACMAAIVAENPDQFDLDQFSAHCHKNLATYALPLFVRFLPQMEITGTFKHRKVELVKEGIDISMIQDKIFYLDTKSKKYLPLDSHGLAQITSQQSRL